ncbi:unnamed protein product, partial [marine sediment metagenome]
SASVLKINDSERVKNIYICSGHGEHLRILNGSLPMPVRSNLKEVKAIRLYEDMDINYKRLPAQKIKEFIQSSLRIASYC